MNGRTESASARAAILPVQALFFGDAALGDFQPALSWLQKNTLLTCGRLGEFGEVRDSIEPDWIVLGQSRDGEVSTRDISVLRRRWPLARCVVMVGSWGEGEQAKQKACLGAWRAAWHQFVPRAAEQWNARAAGISGPWDRPLTLTEDERLDREAGTLRGLTFAILAGEPAGEDLAECLTQLGASCTRGLTGTSIDAAIWVVSDPSLQIDDKIASVGRQGGSSAVVVLTDFPRSTDWPQTLALPYAAILGRPTHVADLATLLREYTQGGDRAIAPSPNLH